MTCPKIELDHRKIILLSGFQNAKPASRTIPGKVIEIEAIEKLQQSAHRHPDAVAFGYVAGKWLPAA